MQISEGYDSYLDERGRGKAKKLANIALYRLFDRMFVSFGVAIICLCKPFCYFVSVIDTRANRLRMRKVSIFNNQNLQNLPHLN